MSMGQESNRRALKAEYREAKQDAGVYRIFSRASDRGIVGTSTNLRSIGNRVEFARSTRSLGALDARLKPLIEADGFEALEFEVLETLDAGPDTSAASASADLKTLETLWKEKLAGSLL